MEEKLAHQMWACQHSLSSCLSLTHMCFRPKDVDQHRDKPYEILRIQQEMLTGISGECLNMLANAGKMQTPELLAFFAFCEYSVCICLVFFRILNICWYPWQMDHKMVLVFLAHCPHTEICKLEFSWIFFHSHKYLQYFSASGNYMSTYQGHFCICKIHFRGLLPVQHHAIKSVMDEQLTCLWPGGGGTHLGKGRVC